MLFSKDTSTHKICKCVGRAENIHDELTSNVQAMVSVLLRGIKSNSRTWKCDNSQNIRSRYVSSIQKVK